MGLYWLKRLGFLRMELALKEGKLNLDERIKLHRINCIIHPEMKDKDMKVKKISFKILKNIGINLDNYTMESNCNNYLTADQLHLDISKVMKDSDYIINCLTKNGFHSLIELKGYTPRKEPRYSLKIFIKFVQAFLKSREAWKYLQNEIELDYVKSDSGFLIKCEV